MNFDDYKTKLPYPRKSDYKTTFWYKGGKLFAKRGPKDERPMLAPEFSERATDVLRLPHDETIDPSYDDDLLAYRLDENRLVEKFQADCIAEHGLTDDPRAGVIYNKAYEDGHSGGFSEIYNYFADIAYFVEKLDNALKGDK